MKRRKLALTKIFTFDTAHALENYPGKCRHIHGHTYKLYVTVKGGVLDQKGHPYDGMIIDFTDLKKWVGSAVIDRFDHALLLREGSTLAALQFPEREKIYLTRYQPSCENMLVDIIERLEESIPAGLTLSKVKLYETPTSYAEWEMEN
ncbi:MAG: 6-carboxytetrahydropterin synthase [Chitinophagaceae bacterium]|nr:6-carboxytetrahydropterin synthase [Chitinophagaceae bacterium]